MNSFNQVLFPSNFGSLKAFNSLTLQQASQQFSEIEIYELDGNEVQALIDSGDLTKKSFITWFERNGVEGYQEGSSDKLKYRSIFLFSKDAILLKELKSKIIPNQDEIIIFIEDNAGDSSSQKHYVSIGKDVRDNLKKSLAYVNLDIEFKKYLSGTGLVDSDDHKQIHKLIEESVAEWTTLDTIWFFLKFTVNQGISNVTGALDGIVEFLEGLKLTEEQWNPEYSDSERFKPYFFPLIEVDLEKGDLVLTFGDNEVNISDFISSGTKVLSKRLNEMSTTVNTYSAPLLVVSSGIASPVLFATDAIIKLSAEGVLILEEIMQFFEDVLVNGVVFINALLCGFCNSIIEAIAGIFFLITLIIKGITGLLSSSDWDEHMDNFTQAIIQLDFSKVWEKIKSGFNLLYDKISESLSDFFTGISFASVGYVIGYLIGMIVELIITSGAGTVKSIFTKTSKTFAGILKKIIEIVTRLVGLKKGATVKEIISNVIRFMRKGTDNVIMLFDELIRVISNWIDEFKSVLKYSVEVLKRTAQKANIYKRYSASELVKIIFRARKLKLSIEDFVGFIQVGNIKKIKLTELLQQMDDYVNIVKKRGYPFKFRNLSEFKRFSNDLLLELKKIAIPIDDVRIQGSCLRKKLAKDVDLAVFVDDDIFNNYLREAFKGRVKLNNQIVDISKMSNDDLIRLANKINNLNSNAISRTFANAIKSGKISALTKITNKKRIIDGHREIIDLLNKKYKDLNIEDISVQKYGGKLELKPDLKLEQI